MSLLRCGSLRGIPSTYRKRGRLGGPTGARSQTFRTIRAQGSSRSSRSSNSWPDRPDRPDTTRLCLQGSSPLSLWCFAGSPRVEASDSCHVMFPTLLDLSPVFKLTLLRSQHGQQSQTSVSQPPLCLSAAPRTKTKRTGRQKRKQRPTVPPRGRTSAIRGAPYTDGHTLLLGGHGNLNPYSPSQFLFYSFVLKPKVTQLLLSHPTRHPTAAHVSCPGVL